MVLQFDALLSAGQIKEAAQYAAATAVLRTSETVQKFQALPKADGGVPPILQYFSVLKESSKLNKLEAVELAKPAVHQVIGLVQLTVGMTRTKSLLSDHSIVCDKM